MEVLDLRYDQQALFDWSTLCGDASGPDCGAPESAEDFARSVIATICHSSVTPSVGRRTFERCMRALAFGSTSRVGFRHPAKAEAIDQIWREREQIFHDYAESTDKLRFISTLRWIGPVNKHSLARRLGLHEGLCGTSAFEEETRRRGSAHA